MLASWGDPAYGFSEHYATTLSHTQYLLYYLAGALLAKVFGAFVANKLLISVYLTGTPIAIRSLLRALGRDPRPAIFAIPFVYNALYGLGLLPYLFGIPLLFFGLAATVSHFERPSLRRGLPLAAPLEVEALGGELKLGGEVPLTITPSPLFPGAYELSIAGETWVVPLGPLNIGLGDWKMLLGVDDWLELHGTTPSPAIGGLSMHPATTLLVGDALTAGRDGETALSIVEVL